MEESALKRLMMVFAAGCLGALANSIAVWLLAATGAMAAQGVAIDPPVTAAWLYPRIVWGGLWGMLFILPILRSRVVMKGFLISLLTTAVQLFIVFPLKAKKGMAGLDLGMLTPAFVLFFNAIWGLVTALAIRLGRL